MKTTPFLPIVLCLIMAGCSTPAVMDPTMAGRETLLGPEHEVPNVRLSTALAVMENDVRDFGFTFRAQSGKVLRQVFTGGEDAPSSLDLVHVDISKSTADVMLFGTKTNLVFTLSVKLRTPDGTQHVLNTTGAGSTAWTIDRAMREAIERATINLAAQVGAVLEN